MASQFINYNILRVLKKNLQATIQFYTKVCGMKYLTKEITSEDFPYQWSDNTLHVFTFEKETKSTYNLTGLCFLVDENFRLGYNRQGYWKIGLGLRDVDSAVSFFNANGCNVQEGDQFMDVGFISSMADPNGYSIELLQHDFEEHFIKPTGEMGILNQPVSVPPVIGQITIRCTDAKKTCQFYTEVLGMKLVCIEQPGNSLPFILYFFAYTDEEPPNSDLHAVENREWLYRQRFCQIEIQHRLSLPSHFRYTANDDNEDGVKLGHVGFALVVSPSQFQKIKEAANDKKVVVNERKCFIYDPDGFLIEVTTN